MHDKNRCNSLSLINYKIKNEKINRLFLKVYLFYFHLIQCILNRFIFAITFYAFQILVCQIPLNISIYRKKKVNFYLYK